jgi:hypothetical protein
MACMNTPIPFAFELAESFMRPNKGAIVDCRIRVLLNPILHHREEMNDFIKNIRVALKKIVPHEGRENSQRLLGSKRRNEKVVQTFPCNPTKCPYSFATSGNAVWNT